MTFRCYRCHEPMSPQGACGCKDGCCLIHGDAREVLPLLEAGCVTAVVTDPPAGIGFMGKEWDKSHGGRDAWIERIAEIAAECLRVCKPGANALVWSLPRTSHWTATAWEDGGWVVKDRVLHLTGQGFPKSKDVSKALDEKACRENLEAELGRPPTRDEFKAAWETFREVVGREPRLVNPRAMTPDGAGKRNCDPGIITAPATDAAKLFDGWGTGLKPAVEDWWLLQKKVDQNYAHNALAHGVAGLAIDASRVGTETISVHGYKGQGNFGVGGKATYSNDGAATAPTYTEHKGRWPANLILQHSDGCRCVGVRKVKGSNDTTGVWTNHKSGGGWGLGAQADKPSYASPDGTETIEAWECVEGCPILELDRQSIEAGMHGAGHATDGRHCGGTKPTGGKHGGIYGEFQPQAAPRVGDSGGASRFFATVTDDRPTRFLYTAKASRSERGKGNKHPTVKSLDLMSWLCRLVSQPKQSGVLLDPFCGSGSTLLAASKWFEYVVGIDSDEESCRTAAERLNEGGLFT